MNIYMHMAVWAAWAVWAVWCIWVVRAAWATWAVWCIWVVWAAWAVWAVWCSIMHISWASWWIRSCAWAAQWCGEHGQHHSKCNHENGVTVMNDATGNFMISVIMSNMTVLHSKVQQMDEMQLDDRWRSHLENQLKHNVFNWSHHYTKWSMLNLDKSKCSLLL